MSSDLRHKNNLLRIIPLRFNDKFQPMVTKNSKASMMTKKHKTFCEMRNNSFCLLSFKHCHSVGVGTKRSLSNNMFSFWYKGIPSKQSVF